MYKLRGGGFFDPNRLESKEIVGEYVFLKMYLGLLSFPWSLGGGVRLEQVVLCLGVLLLVVLVLFPLVTLLDLLFSLLVLFVLLFSLVLLPDFLFSLAQPLVQDFRTEEEV